MSDDFSTVTLHIPTGFYISHLDAMAIASSTFSGLRVEQGGVRIVMVTGSPESDLSSLVELWAHRFNSSRGLQ